MSNDNQLYYNKYLKYKKKYSELKNKMSGGNIISYNDEIELFLNNKKNNTNYKKDSMGILEIPSKKYWGATTQRYINNYPNDLDPIPLDLIYLYATLKKYSAIVNENNNLIDPYRSKIIQEVADEIIDGKLDKNFLVNIWQTGSGTNVNMVLNEVIANRSNEITFQRNNKLDNNNYIHQNDHINKSQSTNDTLPTVINIYFVNKIVTRLQPVIQKLIYLLDEKSKKYANDYKIGRTQLQDAVPITFGQEFSGYQSLIEDNLKSILDSLNYLFEIPIGGTAIGTGINTIENFGVEVTNLINKHFKNINQEYNNYLKKLFNGNVPDSKYLKNHVNVNFVPAPNKFASISGANPLIVLSSGLKDLAVNLIKIGNDLRLMSSGPQNGFNEIIIPQNEPGSSIMPGKVNPTVPELIVMASIDVMSNDYAISFSASQGNFELNVFKSLIFNKINKSIDLFITFIEIFNNKLLSGLLVNKKNNKKNLENSIALATLMNNEIGYNKVSEIVKYSLENNLSLEESCNKFGYSDVYNRIIKPILEK